MRNKTSLITSRHIDPIMPALFKYRYLITLFLLAAVLVSGASAATYEASTLATFTTNLSVAAPGSTIIITGDFEISNVTIDKKITIQSDAGSSHILTAASGERLFFINATGNLTLGDGVTLTDGYGYHGGAVFVDDGGTFTMNGGTITNNSATYSTTGSGGGVYVNNGTFRMNGGTISNNKALDFSGLGGGVFVNGGTFELKGGTITDNSGKYGGGVYMNEDCTFTMSGSGTIIANNTALPEGGGVYVNSGTFTMNGGTFFNNTATESGGAVFVKDSSVFNMVDGTISNNSATLFGGGAVFVKDGGTFNMGDGTITNNTGYLGAGVFVTRGGIFTMNDGTLTNNTADNGGGGVYVNNCMFTLRGGTLTNNTARSGGGVYVENSGTFNMDDATISNNKATTDGGGVYIGGGSSFTINSGTITDNTADNDGGGVHLKGGTFTMDGTGTVTDNTAKRYGGGVYVSDYSMYRYIGTFTMKDGEISGNTAEYTGGGVYVDNGGTLAMSGSATVDTNNDLYLTKVTSVNTYISVTSVLGTGAGALNITPGYLDGIVVSYNNGVSLGTWTNNFALNTTWADANPTLALGQSGNNIRLGTNYSVNFSTLEGTYYLRQYNVSGALLAQPADPTLTGHTFNGWNNTSASGEQWNFAVTTVVGNTNIYANWTVDPTPTPTPTSNGGGGNTQNSDSGSTSSTGAYTSKDGGVELRFDSKTPVIVTVFKDYLGGVEAPPNTEYLRAYDLHSTASKGTELTIVFKIDASELDAKGITTDDVSILHYYDFTWHRMTITSIELVDGVYQFTVVTTKLSPFMVAYNVDRDQFPLEEDGPVETPTTTPTTVVPTTTPTEKPASPLPIVGILAGLCIAIGFRIKNT